MPKFTNHYECPCGTEWTDQWECACDDDCPSCGTTCSPTESVGPRIPDDSIWRGVMLCTSHITREDDELLTAGMALDGNSSPIFARRFDDKIGYLINVELSEATEQIVAYGFSTAMVGLIEACREHDIEILRLDPDGVELADFPRFSW